MSGKKIKNPLGRRILRELRGDFGKYLVVSLFLILTIGFVSGMYVANGSMMQAAKDGAESYKREDGHFELTQEADDAFLTAAQSGKMADAFPADDDFEAVPVTIYENFYKDVTEDDDNDGASDGTVRIYPKTEEVNLASLMDGRFPETKEEIAIDRMHADNVGVKTGDTVTIGGQTYTVTGLIACVNYYTLHEKSTDFMFDALKFDVAMVTQDGWERLNSSVHYAYAWRYLTKPADETAEKHLSDRFLKALRTQTISAGNTLFDYVPAYANPAIYFATDDMGSDEAMGGVLLDILVVIIAFIFAVTISNTIAKESSVIGTLRASGYSRGELVRHYLSMPLIVTLFSAVVGNILGYTLFKNVVISMYYNSYSLPAYQTLWNPEAFFKTTFIPIVLMLVVNLAVIVKMMRHTPLQFLRHDLKKQKKKKAMRLPRWHFLRRFRLRVMLQNISNYVILLVGILFIATMLAMAVGMPDTLSYYKENAKDMMFAQYQYVLKSYRGADGSVIETNDENAEKFAMKTLLRKGDTMEEEVSVYGVVDNSCYVNIDDLDSLAGNEVYISSSFAEKYHIAVGDSITLDEKYEEKDYEFQVAGIYDRCLSLAVFMPIQHCRETFDLDVEAFGGYLSSTKLTDIDESYIATVITERDITKMCDQLDHSMGSYMKYFQVLCILLSAVLIYLLTKIIIEKNENAISMTKILGYENREIAGLYLLSTTVIVVICDAVSMFLGALIMTQAWAAVMADYSGWFPFMITPTGYAKMFLFILIGYLFVMAFDFRRIKKVPMNRALAAQ